MPSKILKPCARRSDGRRLTWSRVIRHARGAEYARQYGAGVRAMVLDGAVPNSLALGGEHAANLEAVLRDLFTRCRIRKSAPNGTVILTRRLRGCRLACRAHPRK